MKPQIWGSHAWIFLHVVTFNYPDNPTYQDKTNMMAFFNSIGNILPCSVCRAHFKNILLKYPITNDVLKNKDSLVKWLIGVHNNVNIQTGKRIYTYDEVIKYYDNLGHLRVSQNMIAFILFVCVMIYFVWTNVFVR